MNRQIKLRAWVNGATWLSTEKYFMSMDGTKWIDSRGHSYSFDSIILSQFTGLLDKNGKEIYEGDIVKLEWLDHHLEPTSFTGEVKWAKWCYHLFREGELSKVLDTVIINSRKPEIIGNIYENPELLQKFQQHEMDKSN